MLVVPYAMLSGTCVFNKARNPFYVAVPTQKWRATPPLAVVLRLSRSFALHCLCTGPQCCRTLAADGALQQAADMTAQGRTMC
jgi:hypothetical protein